MMTETKTLYLIIHESNFQKLIDGRIPKHDFKNIDMYQTLEKSVKVAQWISREKFKERRFVPAVCEVSYSGDDLLRLCADKKLVPPAWWLIMNHLADPQKIDPSDLKLFEKFYPTASFDFYNISIQKSEIVRAYSVSGQGIAVKIYQA